jgi:hypothetical protein
MEASRFDAWTRRRFGFALGGVASLIGLSVLEDAEAKKKHKHKRKKKKKCKKLLVTCGGKKKCCKGLTCGTPVGTTGTVCCEPLQGPCSDASECCGDQICDEIDGLSGTRCCGVVDRTCTVDQDCCTGFVCDVGVTDTCVPAF